MKIFTTRNEMLKSFPKNQIIAELGVFKGEFSKIIYEVCEPKELLLVDLFEGWFGSGDKDGNNYHHVQLEDEMNNIINHFQNDPSVKVIKDSTISFINSLPDNYLDIVYIDADHSYHSVLNDLNFSFNKIKVGGLICGHDYIYDAKVAVDDFCKSKNLQIEYLTQDGCPSFCIKK
jgi:hypothetical protein